MRSLLVLSAFLLTACGQGFKSQNDPRTISGVNPIFKPYVDLYLSHKGTGLRYDIPIQFATLSGNTVGVCTRWSTGERQIQIDQDYWDNYLDEGEKYEVIAHELGHCDLNRDHTPHSMPATSIMDPYVFSLNPSDVAVYMAELFNQSSTTMMTSLSVEKHNCVNDIEVESKP